MDDRSIRDELRALTAQIAQLVHHVAEVRTFNLRLANDVGGLANEFTVMRQDLDRLANEVAVMRRDLDRLANEVAVMRRDLDRLANEVAVMRQDLNRLSGKTDHLANEFTAMRQDLDRLSGKTDHFVSFMADEIMKGRVRIEETVYEWTSERKRIEDRFQQVESRLERIEAVIPGLANG